MYDRAYYLQRAALAAELAEAAVSESVRDQYLQAETHWRELAARAPDLGTDEEASG